MTHHLNDRRALLATLARARRFLLWRAVEQAGLALVVGAVVLALIALWVALAAPLHRGEFAVLRLGFLVAGGLLLLAAAARVVLAPARLEDAAMATGRLLGERDDELLGALELARTRDDDTRTSGALREAAVGMAATRAAGAPIARLSRWDDRGRWLLAAGGVLVLMGITAVAGGARTPAAIRHIADPKTAPIAPIAIRVEPGSRDIEGGESVVIRAYVRGTGQRPRLRTQEGGEWRESSLAPADEAAGARPGERAFSLLLRNLKDDLRYKVRAAGQESPVYALTVRDLPRATGYRVRYEYPAYTGLAPEESHAITGDLAAPRGTRALLTVTLSRSARSGGLIFDHPGDHGGMRIAGATGERLVRFAVPVRSDDRYSIRLEDPRGRRVDLGPFEVRAIPDRPPNVSVLSPGAVEDVGRDMNAVVIAGATDDYGVRKILIKYKVRDAAEKVETLHEEKGTARELAVRYTWALSGYSLLPGEEVEYRIGAVDGDAIDGPQTSWSDARILRFPSAAEILANMSGERDETIHSLENAWQDAHDLQKKAEELSRDLGRSREMTWEKQQEAQKTLEGQQELQKTIDKVAEKLGQDAEKLSQSRALNTELVQKIEELHQILSQIKDQSLLRSIQRLQEALKNLSPEQMEQALQNLKMNQEQVMRSLERTIEMLKQIRTEEKLEAASERAAELERRQIATNDSLSRAKNSEEAKSLAPGERQTSKLGAEQRAALDSLASDLSPQDPEAAKEAERLADELGEEGAAPDFRQTTQSMEQGERDPAKQGGEKLKQRLEEMRKSVDQMREGFQNKRKNQLAKKMEEAAQDLLEIGRLQQGMLSDRSSSLSERAETQKGLEDATSGATRRIADIGKQTLFLTPDIGQALGRALNNQENSVGRYSEQDLAGGLMAGKEAAIALNQAAAGLLKSRQSMQGASSSTGFQEAMERLQGLGGQQQSLNNQSLGMMPGEGQGQGSQGSRLSEGQGQALSRMAAEQEAIRRGLEETMQKLGQGGGTMGNMGSVADDMKQVEQDLRGGRLNQETVDRQQRILSRLLDAPRSVERRDYSRKRQSRPGVDVVRSSPGALSPELLRTRPSLAALLARAGRDPVTPRYRALVDEYLQSVLGGKAK
ncbi:MAG TPA: hypothetical protein VK123_08195 [Candidatus Limnocylindrales bacterium]|nr:hypothetical protein [Candidatus Limnocylindrales bacterium]